MPESSHCANIAGIPWFAGRDRACQSDAECTVLTPTTCQMVPLNRLALPTYKGRACSFEPLGACQCSIPLSYERCHEGCCQLAIGNPQGPFYP